MYTRLLPFFCLWYNRVRNPYMDRDLLGHQMTIAVFFWNPRQKVGDKIDDKASPFLSLTWNPWPSNCIVPFKYLSCGCPPEPNLEANERYWVPKRASIILGVITVQRIQKRSFGAPSNLAEIVQASTVPQTSKKKIKILHTYVCRFGCSSAFNRFGAPLRIREKDGMHHISFEWKEPASRTFRKKGWK